MDHDVGTQGERVERVAVLAKELAPLVGANPEKAERAARLAKADLVCEMVGEFPELQVLMGRYYATEQGEDPSVAAAVEGCSEPQRVRLTLKRDGSMRVDSAPLKSAGEAPLRVAPATSWRARSPRR